VTDYGLHFPADLLFDPSGPVEDLGPHLPQYPELVSPPPKILNRFFLLATSAVCTFSALINHHHLHLQSIDTCLSIYRCQISLLHLLSLAYLLICLQELAMRLLQSMQKI